MIETVNTETPYLSSDEVLRISNTTGDEVSYSFGDILKLDREYTFSCWMRADSETTTTVGISTKSETFMLGIEWTQVVFTAMADISSSKEVYFTIPSGTILYAYEGQLEEGTKNSDFSYNPDDILESISIIDGKYTALSTSFEVEQGRIESLIQETTIDGVSLKDRYLETVATVDGISTKVSSIETNFNDLTTRVNSAEQRITDDAIVSTVRSSQLYSADLGEKANSKEIISIINQSAESILINASKINLTGYVTISALQNAGSTVINGSNITTGTISAQRLNLKGLTVNNGSTNTLVIDSSGNVTMNNLVANNGTFSGTVNATKGSIGGFGINNTGFTKTTAITLKKTYTSADVTRVENIIKGSVTPTTSDYNYYDINNSGTITALDLIWIEKILVPCGGNILYTDVIINSYPLDTNDINKPMMTVRYRGTNGTTICESSISARTLSTLIINANSITANTLSVKYGDTLNDFGNKTQFTCYNDDSSVGGIIYAEYFSGTPNFYILAENGGYLTLGTLGNRWYFQDVDDTNWKSAFYPRYTGSALGKSGNPWYRLYAENSTTVTSDRRVKCDFRNMDERYIEFVEYLMPQLYHRIGHENLPLESGFVAQDVEQAMIKAGISNDELGLVEHYVNEEEGIDRYSLIYEGFISILFYYIQKKNMSYEERLKKLEEAILYLLKA